MTGIRRGWLPDRILDILDSDGGWLTGEGVQLLMPDARPEAVLRALWRLTEQNRIRHRSVELAFNNNPNSTKLESRSEWRVL